MTKIQPTLEMITDERKRATMAASRLEADILQTVIRHAQENHTPITVIILALANSTNHWINKSVNNGIAKMLHDELNYELLSTDAVNRIHNHE